MRETRGLPELESVPGFAGGVHQSLDCPELVPSLPCQWRSFQGTEQRRRLIEIAVRRENEGGSLTGRNVLGENRSGSS